MNETTIFKRTLGDSTRGTEECWPWQGKLDVNGYGIGSYGRSVRAHRSTWLYLRGAIPLGLEIDHLCRNRSCVNPAHMELVTHAENIRRRLPTHKECPHGAMASKCAYCKREAIERYRANNPDWRERHLAASKRSYNKRFKWIAADSN